MKPMRLAEKEARFFVVQSWHSFVSICSDMRQVSTAMTNSKRNRWKQHFDFFKCVLFGKARVVQDQMEHTGFFKG